MGASGGDGGEFSGWDYASTYFGVVGVVRESVAPAFGGGVVFADAACEIVSGGYVGVLTVGGERGIAARGGCPPAFCASTSAYSAGVFHARADCYEFSFRGVVQCLVLAPAFYLSGGAESAGAFAPSGYHCELPCGGLGCLRGWIPFESYVFFFPF